MKSKIEKLIVGIFILIFISNVKVFGAEAGQIKLPRQNGKIYSAGKNKIENGAKEYWLKVKLKPKIIPGPVYWQNRKKIDWQKEIRNWHFGFLPKDENLPPIIICKENFYPQEQDFQGKFRWMSNNARLSVINPQDAPVRTSFVFECLSFKKKRKLVILFNYKTKMSIEVPSDKEKKQFKKFVMKGIVLNPGRNDILFYTPDGTDTLKPREWEKERKREVSIKFKSFKFETARKINSSKEINKDLPKYKYVITDKGLNLLVNFEKQGQRFLLMSRDINIDLEEYPYFSLDYAIGENNANLDVFFGIDYNGDGRVDGYLNPEFLKGINLFELAKNKWPSIDYFKYGFKLKKIILMLSKKQGYLNFKFRGFKIYNLNSSIRIPVWQANESNLVIKQIKNVAFKLISNKEARFLTMSMYFDSKNIGTKAETVKKEAKFILKNGNVLTGKIESENNEEFKLSNVRELQGGNAVIKKDTINYHHYLFKQVKRKEVLEDEYAVIEIPVNLMNKVEAPCLDLTYKLDNPIVQGIELFFGIDKNGDGNVDERIMAGEKELIRGFKFIGTKGKMDLYEAYLSKQFPSIYKSTGVTKSRFIIYKNGKPLKLTWGKWRAGTELVEVGVSPGRVIISLPQGKIPDAVYSIIYWPASKPSRIYRGYQELEIPVEIDLSKIKKVILKLKRKKQIEAKGWFNFYIKELGLYKKFPYPLKGKGKEAVGILKNTNISLVKINNKIFHLSDFGNWQSFEDLERGTLVKEIKLAKGNHKYEKLKNPTFNIEWAILEPAASHKPPVTSNGPEITFKKINPTKYLVKVNGAKRPFWLVFSESFHKQWRIYSKVEVKEKVKKEGEFGEIVADYPKLGVKEAKHLMKFTPEDIKYLFKRPLNAEHQLVNGYANGWYIEPNKSGLGENFVLVIYFWPQSLFYLGLFISGMTLLGCLVYLAYSFVKRKNKRASRES